MVRYKFAKIGPTTENEVSVKVTSSNLYEVLDFIGKTGVLSGLIGNNGLLRASGKIEEAPTKRSYEDYIVMDVDVESNSTMVSVVLTAEYVRQMYGTTKEKSVNSLNHLCEWIHNRFENEFDTSDLTITELSDVLSACILCDGEEDYDEIYSIALKMHSYRDICCEDIVMLEDYVERARKRI